MIKLLYIANLRLPTEKAHGLQISKMCEAFASQDVEVILVYPFRKNQEKGDIFSYYFVKHNFKTKEIWAPDFYFPSGLDKISFYIKSFISAVFLSIYVVFKKPDFIYSRDELPLFLLSPLKKNLVYEAHRFSRKKNLFYRCLKRYNIKIVAISQGLKDEFVRHGFVAKNILAAHDGVDLKQFNISEGTKDCRARLGLPQNKKIIGYVGQLRTMGMEKGIKDLIQAYTSLKNKFSDLILVIVGGNEEDVKTYNDIAIKIGLSEQDIIFTGQKEHKEIPYYLRSFDVLTMPFPRTQHYAFYMSPLKLFEYMASGRPIVASNLPSLKEILNENNSVLVEPDSVESLSEGIKKVLENNILADRIGAQGFGDVQKYTWSKRAENIFKFIDN